MNTLNDNLAVRMVHTPATYAAAAVYGTWINMTGFRNCMFIPANGELDGNIVMAVYEATDNAGTGAQALTGIADTFHNGSDEARVGILEVREADLSSGYSYITVLVTPAATDSFSCVAVLDKAYSGPVLNGTAQGVAFNTGE